jgi:hypothetical protein
VTGLRGRSQSSDRQVVTSVRFSVGRIVPRDLRWIRMERMNDCKCRRRCRVRLYRGYFFGQNVGAIGGGFVNVGGVQLGNGQVGSNAASASVRGVEVGRWIGRCCPPHGIFSAYVRYVLHLDSSTLKERLRVVVRKVATPSQSVGVRTGRACSSNCFDTGCVRTTTRLHGGARQTCPSGAHCRFRTSFQTSPESSACEQSRIEPNITGGFKEMVRDEARNSEAPQHTRLWLTSRRPGRPSSASTSSMPLYRYSGLNSVVGCVSVEKGPKSSPATPSCQEPDVSPEESTEQSQVT